MAKKIVSVKNPTVHELPRVTSSPLRHRPGVNELPVDLNASSTVAVLLGEINSVRARLTSVENDILNLKLGLGVVGNPHELPKFLEG